MALVKQTTEPSLEGFSTVKRYWNTEKSIMVAKILPGEFYVTNEDELITTVLGSCISACIRDKISGVGGMNHFMLPETSKEKLQRGNEAVVGNAMRYGNYAMEHLINTILEHGGKRKNLEVKLFGGGKVIPTMGTVGEKNVEFVLEYVDAEGLTLLSQDLGDIYPRNIQYFPKTGKVRMKKVQNLHNDKVVKQELEYRTSIKDTVVESTDIELF
jgi:chemotaxis protein CheD